MNQTLTGDFAVPMNDARAEGLFPSLCTIFSTTDTIGSSGAVVFPGLPPTAISGLANIPCTKPPISEARIQATEAKSLAELMGLQIKHVLLNGYYPTIEDGVAKGWAAYIGDNDGAGNIINGKQWDILGAESDSHEQMTRLGVRIASLG